MNWQDHIIFDPNILFGKAIIRGTRIPVDLVLEKLATGYSQEDLLEAYPRITKPDITACLLYASDNAKHDKILSIA